ncbi:MAG: helix-turn-helix transcriptional regulator [Eubacteriales bacterium]
MAKKLIELRRGKSQSEVAKSIGIATSTLGMYETEQRIPRDSIKIMLADYYNTTVQKIFFE